MKVSEVFMFFKGTLLCDGYNKKVFHYPNGLIDLKNENIDHLKLIPIVKGHLFMIFFVQSIAK